MNLRRLLTVFLALGLVASSGVGAAALAINTSSELYPSTYVHEDELGVAAHNMSGMSELEYVNDSGEIAQVDATVNGTEAGETVKLRLDKIEEDDFGAFPRNGDPDGNISVLNASEWTSSGVSVAQTDDKTADGVRSITLSTSGFSSGSSGSATFGNVDIDSGNKRVLQLVVNVESLEAGAEGAFVIEDEDGDEKRAVINSSRNASSSEVIATSTGSGVLYQKKLGELPTVANGDGSFDGISAIHYEATDGDVNVTLVALNAEKFSTWNLGTERVSDGEDGHEDATVTEHAGGELALTGVDSLGETFDDAVIHELKYLNVEYRTEDSPEATVEFTDGEDYPSFPSQLHLTTVLEPETGYDLSHGNLELRTEQTFLANRYVTLRYAEAIGDTSVENVSEDSWMDATGSLGEKNSTLVVDSSVQPGSAYALELRINILEDEESELQQSASVGGFWGSSDSGSSNPLSSMVNWLVGGIAGLLAAVGIKLKGLGGK